VVKSGGGGKGDVSSNSARCSVKRGERSEGEAFGRVMGVLSSIGIESADTETLLGVVAKC